MDIELIAKQWFSDYLNPTENELRKWVADSSSIEMGQDWDITIGDSQNIQMFARLACAEKLVNQYNKYQRKFIVHCLYLATADAFNHANHSIAEAIALVRDSSLPDVSLWRSKAEHLLEHPGSYQEEDWLTFMST